MTQYRQPSTPVEQFPGAHVIARMLRARYVSGRPEHQEPISSFGAPMDQGHEILERPAILVLAGTDVKADCPSIAGHGQGLAYTSNGLRRQYKVGRGWWARDIQGTKQSIDPLNLVKRSTRVPTYNLLRDAGESGERAHL
jgi:hypothetical protein